MSHSHTGQPVVTAGVPLDKAKVALIAVHGRGATAESILQLAAEIGTTDVAYLAPQANLNTWYPHSFLAPMEQNEPGLSAGLALLDEVVTSVSEQGISREKIVLMGFSQGACLALEYAARHAGRYGGVIAFSGGLIGPPGMPRNYAGSMSETPIFIGCSDVDFHIPLERVKETTIVLSEMGANVDERIYPSMGHTINQDELTAAQQIVGQLI